MESSSTSENQKNTKQKLNKDDIEEIKKSVKAFQLSVDKVREGRTTVGYKLFDFYHDWFNNLMLVSITIGTALTALSTIPDFEKYIRLPFFWIGVSLMICNGIYILMFKKRGLEKESLRAATMGYETEYYLLLLRNRTEDVIKGRPVDPNELITTKDTLLSKASDDIDESYQENKKIDHRMDVSVLVLIAGLLCIVLSTFKNDVWLIFGGLISLSILLAFLLFFKRTAKEAREALAERDLWLQRIKTERFRD